MQPSISSMLSIPPSPATIFSALVAMSFSLVSRADGRPLRVRFVTVTHGWPNFTSG